MVLDEKTEKIAALEKEIALKGQQIIGNEQQIRDLQHKNEWVYLYIYIFIKFNIFLKIIFYH